MNEVKTEADPSHGGRADIAEKRITLNELWAAQANPDEARNSNFETKRSYLVSVATMLFPYFPEPILYLSQSYS